MPEHMRCWKKVEISWIDVVKMKIYYIVAWRTGMS